MLSTPAFSTPVIWCHVFHSRVLRAPEDRSPSYKPVLIGRSHGELGRFRAIQFRWNEISWHEVRWDLLHRQSLIRQTAKVVLAGTTFAAGTSSGVFVAPMDPELQLLLLLDVHGRTTFRATANFTWYACAHWPSGSCGQKKLNFKDPIWPPSWKSKNCEMHYQW